MKPQGHSRINESLLRVIALLLALAVSGGGSFALAQTAVEEQNSPGAYQINAPALYSRGVTGSGVTIAIVDTGLLTTHPEFAGRVLPGYNVFDGSLNATDGNGHGTHVAGILGGGRGNPSDSGMFGVAYNAYLMPIRVLNSLGFGSSAGIANGIQVAVNRRNAPGVPETFKPFVMNLSLGSSTPSPQIESALRNAVASINGGMSVVAAAGNSGTPDPGYPARYAKEAWANGQIIAVGAVDANNNIANFSNRAGDTKNFFLVAPGVDVYSTFTAQGHATYDTLSGTSMASPYVTGAVALVKSGWSFLTARKINSILFATATDLGEAGVDDVYGRGLLNLEAAMQPVGSLAFPTSSSSSIALSGTALISSPATGAALQAAGRAGFLQVAGFDSYGRNFQVDLAPTLRQQSLVGNSLAPMLAAVDAAAERKYLRNGGTFRVAHRSEITRLLLGQKPAGDGAGSGEGAAFAVSDFDDSGRELVFGVSSMGAQSFGLAGELARRGDTHLTAALGNPYFSLASQHTHAGIGLPLAGGLRVKFGMLASDSSASSQIGMPQMSGRRQSMSLAEVSGGLDAAAVVWSVSIGRLQESNAVLGTTQSGALGLTGVAGTNVVSAGFALSPAERVKLGAQYSVGYTGDVTNRTDSLVTGYSSGRSEAYAVFASLQEAFVKGDGLSLTVSQPLRVVSGVMQMVVPVRADENGSPVMESRSISLKPDGRETRADLLYMSPLNRSAMWFMGVGVRYHPNHDPAAASEKSIGAGIRAVF